MCWLSAYHLRRLLVTSLYYLRKEYEGTVYVTRALWEWLMGLSGTPVHLWPCSVSSRPHVTSASLVWLFLVGLRWHLAPVLMLLNSSFSVNQLSGEKVCVRRKANFCIAPLSSFKCKKQKIPVFILEKERDLN